MRTVASDPPFVSGSAGRQAGADRHPVVPSDLHDLGVADRDVRDVLGRDGLLVVGQRIGRDPADPPQRGIQAGHDGRQRLVEHRDDDPEPRPGQPGAPQRCTSSADARSLAPVPLQPERRLGDPGPIDPVVPRPHPGFHLGDRSAGGAVPAGEAHRSDPPVHDVRAYPPLRGGHQLLDLVHEFVDRTGPVLTFGGTLTRLPQLDIPLHRVVVDAGQLGRGTVTPREVVCLKDFHDLPAVLHTGQLRWPVSVQVRGGIRPPVGKLAAIKC